MHSLRRISVVGSIALSFSLFAGFPALALAGGAKPQTGASLTITGHVTALVGGANIAGIEVYCIGTVVGENSVTVVTNSSGVYTVPVFPSNTYAVGFTDPAHKYLYGDYFVHAPDNFAIGGNSHSDVVVTDTSITDINVEMTVGMHIKGTVTGPGTPPKGLYGIVVAANSGELYSANTVTATNGTYSITVPAGDYTVQFRNNGAFYGSVTGAATVGASDATGVNASLALREGVQLVVTPDGTTVGPGSIKSFTATLTNPQNQVLPAKGSSDPNISDATAYTTFTISPSGHCTGRNCVVTTVGEYTITGTYGALTDPAALHVTADGPVTTPATTSTESPADGHDSSPVAAILLGLGAAAFMLLGLRHRIPVRNS